MPGSRLRRVVRCAWISAAVLILLPVWYVSAWLTVSRAERDRYISKTTAWTVRPAFAPLLDYCKSDLPGSKLLGRIWWSVNPPVFLSGSFGSGGGSGMLVGKIWMIPTLSPPQTAAVEAFVQEEFSPRPRWKLQRKSAGQPWIAVSEGDGDEPSNAK